MTAATLAVFAASCSSGEDRRERAASDYVARADATCERGRARFRADPDAGTSTQLLAELEEELRQLGDPPPAVGAIGSDVPFALALVTWSAESFNAAGRSEIGDSIITVEQLRRLGFAECGRRW